MTKFTYSFANGGDTALRQWVEDKDLNRTSYSYDSLGRLERAERKTSGGSFLEGWGYAYDKNSNRCALKVQTALGQALPVCNGAPDPNITYYTHNDPDQLTSITPQGQSPIPMSYTGPGQFERVTRGFTTFATGALGLGREQTGTATTDFTRDDDGLLLALRTGPSATNTYYPLFDGIGSLVALTDSNGDLAASYKYEPFGKQACLSGCSIANPYQWLGGLGVYLDSATGLYKMGTRYYDPALGRLTQVDPVEGGSANRYDYAGQDPINSFDRTGERHTPPNGCGSSGWSSRTPDIFRGACDLHDRCYGTWGRGTLRSKCDAVFKRAMLDQCRDYSWLREKACNAAAEGYYQGVRHGARGAFINSQVAECVHFRYGKRHWCKTRAERRADV